ncbi:MAG: hypothetical protein GY871_04315 [Actinomycetales bacterium]|nr:hypothetical protein [Actinomycetales bacterium]
MKKTKKRDVILAGGHLSLAALFTLVVAFLVSHSAETRSEFVLQTVLVVGCSCLSYDEVGLAIKALKEQ